MAGLWLLGVPGRMRTINEGKVLTQQIHAASQTGAALANTAQQIRGARPSMLLPGAVAVGGGLLASKIAADAIAPRNKNATANYVKRLQAENYANFVALDLLATVENGLATTIHAVRNSGLKKKLAAINNNNDLIKAGIEQERASQMRSIPTKLAGIGLGTAAIATPTMVYMNNKYQSEE